MPLNPPRPAQSQAWQWTNGKDYSATREVPGNGARGGSCAALTYHSGECRSRSRPSARAARCFCRGCAGHSCCPSSPPAPCLSLPQALPCGPAPTAPRSITTSASSTPCTEHGPGPRRTPRWRRSSRATSVSLPATPINTSYKKKKACKCCVSLVLVQSPGLLRERERRALPRLPELPEASALPARAKLLGDESPGAAGTVALLAENSGLLVPALGHQTPRASLGSRWGHRSVPRAQTRRPGTQTWVGPGAVESVQAWGQVVPQVQTAPRGSRDCNTAPWPC